MSTRPPYPDDHSGAFPTARSEDEIMEDAPGPNPIELLPHQAQRGDLPRNALPFSETSQRQTRSLRSERSTSPLKRPLAQLGAAGVQVSEAENLYPPLATVTHGIVKGSRIIQRDVEQEGQGRESKQESNELKLAILQLENERRECERLEMLLTSKNAELEGERQKYESRELDWEEKYTELEKERDEVRKGWRKAAKELNKISVQGQGFYQVTDQFLIDKTSVLRYSIRNFAIQYFDGEMKQGVKLRPTEYFEAFIKPLTQPVYEELILSPTRCSSFVQSILWRVLTEEVFEMPFSNSHPGPEAERKFQMWSATTTGLLSEKLDLNDGSKEYQILYERKERRVGYIYKTIEPFSRVMDEGFQKDLFKIISDAVTLDLEISKQVARVTWVFDNGPFNPDLMELEAGENSCPENEEVQLIVAPGLKKRGKSTGDGFKTENTLLLIQVSCEPVLARRKKKSR
ncbi:hypothetical protein BGZ60DRAFT_535442 [Tricladium varicosporioides]|nr:hypothetical protein BGZ60DRAFT_535442 [Hymenoscyphus varicosporioides]